jgi:hypothetical protein
MNLLQLAAFARSMVIQAYAGIQVAEAQPYSFHSVQLADTTWTGVPQNAHTVYWGYLKISGGNSQTVTYKGQNFIVNDSTGMAMPVFFDGQVYSNTPEQSNAGPQQFIGFKFTVGDTLATG